MTNIDPINKTLCKHENVSEHSGIFLIKGEIVPGIMRNCKDCKKFLDMLSESEYKIKYHPDQSITK